MPASEILSCVRLGSNAWHSSRLYHPVTLPICAANFRQKRTTGWVGVVEWGYISGLGCTLSFY